MTESVLLVWYNKRPASESIPLRNIFRGGTYPAEEHRYPAPQSLPANRHSPPSTPIDTLHLNTLHHAPSYSSVVGAVIYSFIFSSPWTLW